MADLKKYRASDIERMRTVDLERALPRGRRSALDIGARDGHFSRILTEYFAEVTALDLEKPTFELPRVSTVAGDVTKLEYGDNAFDCVFCAEVLEHIPDVRKACREIIRVAKHEIVIGVPFRQDTRVGRTTCQACGRPNPPWGHVNSFDEDKLHALFPGVRLIAKSFVGTTQDASNPLAGVLMDLGGNPWGTYDQDEPCLHCGAQLKQPMVRSLPQRLFSAMAFRIERLQSALARPHGNWIHLVFSKDHGEPQDRGNRS
jgi:SAM-dependent methyltransferase